MIDFFLRVFRLGKYHRTCKKDGCGFEEPNRLDDKCRICRLPME